MLAAITFVDYGVLALYLAVMIAIGLYFSREQKSGSDFFLAGRSMGWFPVGLSVMATLLSALSYSGIPGEAYYVGTLYLLMPAAVWLTAPLLVWGFLPLFRRLELFSVYEYLELRFGVATRIAASFAFILWRLFWLGGVLYAPCKVLVVAAGLEIREPLLLIVLGAVSTAYTLLGGMKAVIWTDVIQSIVMAGGLVLIIGGVWWAVGSRPDLAPLDSLRSGAEQVWQTAEDLERTRLIEPAFDWNARWSVWAMTPHVVLSMLSFYIADQITAQRFLTAKSLNVARWSFVLNCVSVSLMVPALVYAGTALMAFYQQQPQEMRPVWVASVELPDDGGDKSAERPYKGRQIAGVDGRALLDWREDGPRLDHARLDERHLDELVRQGRLIEPNRKEPIESADGVLIEREGRTELEIHRLALSKATPGRPEQPEVIVAEQAQDEFLPRFITNHLPLGVAGLILAALFAASMSSMDSGLNSIAALAISDYYRRFAWIREMAAALFRKPAKELSDANELLLSRLLVLVIGAGATFFSLFVGLFGDIFDIMIGIVNTFGGPLLSVFLLGVFTRRANSAGAIAALAGGTLFTIWLMMVNRYDVMLESGLTMATNVFGLAVVAAAGLLLAAWPGVWIWRSQRLTRTGGLAAVAICAAIYLMAAGFCAARLPLPAKLNSVWLVIFGVSFSLVAGYAASFIPMAKKGREELRGLVLGIGPLGERKPAAEKKRPDLSRIVERDEDEGWR